MTPKHPVNYHITQKTENNLFFNALCPSCSSLLNSPKNSYSGETSTSRTDRFVNLKPVCAVKTECGQMYNFKVGIY